MRNDKYFNILISGCYGIRNSGDEAILLSILESLKEIDNIKVNVFSFNPNDTLKRYSDFSLNSHSHSLISNPLRTINVIKNCDLFILGGGGLIQDQTSIFNIPFWLSKLVIANFLNKKTYVFANSIGPLSYSISKKLVSKVFKKVNLITLRDRISYLMLKNINIRRNMFVTTDPVFSLNLNDLSSHNSLMNKIDIDKKFVVISLRHWFDTFPIIPVKYCVKFNIKTKNNRIKWNNLVHQIELLVNWINHELDLSVIFIGMCPDRDDKIVDEIMSRVLRPEKNKYFPAEPDPYNVIRLIENSEFLIGMRLHSLIYSAIVKKPFIALSYSDKIDGMLTQVGLEKYNVNVNTINVGEVIDLVKILLKDYWDIKLKLENYKISSSELNKKNLELLKKMIN